MTREKGGEEERRGGEERGRGLVGRGPGLGTLGLLDLSCLSRAHLRPSHSFHCRGPWLCPPGVDTRAPTDPEARALPLPLVSGPRGRNAAAEEALGWAQGSGGGAGRVFFVRRRCTRYDCGGGW